MSTLREVRRVTAFLWVDSKVQGGLMQHTGTRTVSSTFSVSLTA